MKNTSSRKNCSIIELDKFIQATRDSGYKGTASAVAELVDNSIQAGANQIDITVTRSKIEDPLSFQFYITDNGYGMDPSTLRQALRFGGSTRFNSRNGLGRYGMGLPNCSLSQARRVTVYTWQKRNDVYSTYLDVDKIASGNMKRVPIPRSTSYPFDGDFGISGTIVMWSQCDRLDNRRVSTITRKLISALGRRFRFFIWEGVKIIVNGDLVEAIDPLYLHPKAKFSGAEIFGEPMEYEVQADSTNGINKTGLVRIKFSELPVHKWHKMPKKEKRRIGISKGAGVSVIRAGREVDYGWFFLGGKRRETYDDWWRCEIQFDPILDEAFGLTHTKQQIRPKSYLFEALSTDIESIARALNGRVRKAHLALKAVERFSESEKMASERDKLLEPFPIGERDRDRLVLNDLKKRHPELRQSPKISIDNEDRVDYRIVESAVKDMSFFTYAREEGRLVLALNSSHPFYKQIYKPLADSDKPRDCQLRIQIELLLLSLARSEAAQDDPKILSHIEQQRVQWSNILATFLNG
jgi:hypothetical protein